MKHLFYIHSNITYLVAKAVVDYHRLQKEKIIFLFARNVKPRQDDSTNYRCLSLDGIPDFNYHRNIFKAWPKIFTFKKMLGTVTDGENYFAYVPQTKERVFQILIHNNLCTGFSILEEGTDSYLRKDQLLQQHQPRIIDWFERINYLNLVKSNQFIQDGYKNLYAVSERSFPGYDRKIVLQNVLASHANGAPVLKDRNLLILDSISIYNDISLSTHVHAVQKVLNYFLDRGIKEVLYKYHPAQLHTAEEEAFENLFKKYQSKITLRRMDDDMILEHVLVKGRQLSLFINISSLGLYATMFGHRVYSLINYVSEKEELGNLFERYPRHYLENIHFLN